MDLFEFNTLPLQYQAQFTWDHGRFLATRKTDTHLINLYYTSRFYVEVYFSIRNKGVDKISSFTDTHDLDPYLDDIVIPID